MRFAQLAQLLSIATTVASMALFIWQYQLIHVLRQGGTVSDEMAQTCDRWVDTFDWLQLGTTLLAFTAFIFWFYRAYQNAHRLPYAKPEYRESTAGWSWFVPLMNLWVPYRIMGEIGHYYGRFSPYRTQTLASRWKYWVTGWAFLSVSTLIMARLTSYATATLTHNPLQMEIANRFSLAYLLISVLYRIATLMVLKAMAPYEQELSLISADEVTTDALPV